MCRWRRDHMPRSHAETGATRASVSGAETPSRSRRAHARAADVLQAGAQLPKAFSHTTLLLPAPPEKKVYVDRTASFNMALDGIRNGPMPPPPAGWRPAKRYFDSDERSMPLPPTKVRQRTLPCECTPSCWCTHAALWVRAAALVRAAASICATCSGTATSRTSSARPDGGETATRTRSQRRRRRRLSTRLPTRGGGRRSGISLASDSRRAWPSAAGVPSAKAAGASSMPA